MSTALLEQLHAAELSSSASPTAVRDLLTAWAPQLLQLEQQAAAAAEPDHAAAQLNQWVARYCTQHEADAIVQANAAALARAVPSRNASSSAADASTAADSDGSPSAPAPLFFYLLQHPAPGTRELCLQFLSALFTDPATDQDFYWLNDPAAFVGQLRDKVARTRSINQQIAQQYALNKSIDAVELSRHVVLFAGIVEVLQSLLQTRSRALTSQLSDVRALLEETGREKWRAQWQLWMASSDPAQGSSNLLALETALAASGDANAWHHAVALQRRNKATLHARAFRSFLQPASQPLLLELAPLLVDNEYSEESELFVDRLWSLATNSFQHDAHGENAASASGSDDGAKVSWSYPPPSVHALLDVFLLPDGTPEVAPSATAATPPPSYKLWLVYYLLLDFEQRNAPADPSAPMLSVEFAHAAGLTQAQQKLIAGMVHMDAAYTPSDSSISRSSSSISSKSSNGSAILSSDRRASFLAALECFSFSYDALLSQPDFAFVSSVLASILALQQWSAGVTFFQNCFTANAALVASSISTSQRQAQIARYNANRRVESVPMPIGAVQVHAVFYSTLHHVLYVHILLQKGLFFESVQFIRSQTQLDAATAAPLHTPLQVVLWRYWNQHLLYQRQYDVLLKQVALAPLEERLLLSYWKQHLTLQSQQSSAAPDAPTLTTADLIVLYAFEHHDIERGLRFYAAFQRMQARQHAAQRLALRIPRDIVAAYAKLVHFDLQAAVAAAADEDGDVEGVDDDESDELDLCAIQLREVERSVAALQINNRSLLQRILSAHAEDDVLDGGDMDQSVDMLDAQRGGSELNPFAPSNERARKSAAAAEVAAKAAAEAAAKAAALARSKSSPAKPSPAKPSPAKPARIASEPEAAAPAAVAAVSAAAPEHKSPEKTPRVQRLPASQSAAKAKRAQIAKEEADAKAKEQAEAAEKQKHKQQQPSMDQQAEQDEAEAEASPEEMFPSFASPAPPSRTSSFQRALTTPPPAAAAAAVPSPVQPMVSPARVLISSSKPLAFSDLSEEQARDPASFLLPLPDSTAAVSSAAAAAAAARSHAVKSDAAPVRTASKRATRATKSDSVERATSEPASPVPSVAALPSFTPLSSAHFTPSLLAPSALTTSARIRSSRKRPLLSQPPMLLATAAPLSLSSRPLSPAHQLPVAELDGADAAPEAKAPAKGAAARKTRATRSKQRSSSRMEESEEEEGKDEEDEVEESVAGDENGSATTAEDESAIEERPSRRTSPKATRTRRTTRRSADLDADASMDEVVQTAAAPAPARSTRRATAHTPAHTAESNPFQRSASMSSTGTTGRRSRAAPIFIDESLLMSGPPAAAGDDRSEMDDGEEDAEIAAVGSRRTTRRAASSRGSTLAVPASADPSPSPSTSTSPSRPSRAAARRAAFNIATSSSPAPAASRSSRARASGAAAANEPAPTSSRRATRHVDAADAELPPVATRSTRSKAK